MSARLSVAVRTSRKLDETYFVRWRRSLYRKTDGMIVMSTTMTVSEARAALPAIIRQVLEGEEVTLTRHGAWRAPRSLDAPSCRPRNGGPGDGTRRVLRAAGGRRHASRHGDQSRRRSVPHEQSKRLSAGHDHRDRHRLPRRPSGNCGPMTTRCARVSCVTLSSAAPGRAPGGAVPCR